MLIVLILVLKNSAFSQSCLLFFNFRNVLYTLKESRDTIEFIDLSFNNRQCNDYKISRFENDALLKSNKIDRDSSTNATI